MTRKSRASAGITRRQAYQVSGQPCTSSSGGPSPPMTACRRSARASTYRLVNVSVNPSARFGACETEPGPSAASRPVDDALMWGSPLTAVTALECRFRHALSRRHPTAPLLVAHVVFSGASQKLAGAGLFHVQDPGGALFTRVAPGRR